MERIMSAERAPRAVGPCYQAIAAGDMVLLRPAGSRPDRERGNGLGSAS